jgi:hypothetical protein
MATPYPVADRQLIERSSNFTISLLSRDEAWGDPNSPRRVHQTVLQPLLAVAEECWAYGIEKGSAVWKSAADILTPEKGKFRVKTTGDPVTGRELFWNASGGKRGTIAVVVPLALFKPEQTFAACRGAWVFENYRSGHTPAAVKLAQARIESQDQLVFCLPRNNGIEWIEVFASNPQVFDLYAQALQYARET